MDIETKTSRLTELDNITSSPDFWSASNTKEVLEEQKQLRTIVGKFEDVNDTVSMMIEMCELELSNDDLESFISDIGSSET